MCIRQSGTQDRATEQAVSKHINAVYCNWTCTPTDGEGWTTSPKSHLHNILKLSVEGYDLIMNYWALGRSLWAFELKFLLSKERLVRTYYDVLVWHTFLTPNCNGNQWKPQCFSLTINNFIKDYLFWNSFNNQLSGSVRNHIGEQKISKNEQDVYHAYSAYASPVWLLIHSGCLVEFTEEKVDFLLVFFWGGDYRCSSKLWIW